MSVAEVVQSVLWTAIPFAVGIAMNGKDDKHFLVARILFAVSALAETACYAWWWLDSTDKSAQWAVFWGFSLFFYWVATAIGISWISRHEKLTLNRLYPGNEESPPLPKPPVISGFGPLTIPEKSIYVFCGGITATSSLDKLVIFRMDGQEMFSVERRGEYLAISKLIIFDDRNDVIANVENNEFWVHGGARYKKPNQRTLIVYDHLGEQVLNLVFVNKKVLKIENALFRHPQVEFIRATNDTVETRDSKTIGSRVFECKEVYGLSRAR